MKACPFCGCSNPVTEVYPVEGLLDAIADKQVFRANVCCRNMVSCGASVGTFLNDEAAAREAAEKAWNKRPESKEQDREIAVLQQWKKEQMLVAADTHYGEVARELDLTLGTYIAPAILPAIKRFKSALTETLNHSFEGVCDGCLHCAGVNEIADHALYPRKPE